MRFDKTKGGKKRAVHNLTDRRRCVQTQLLGIQNLDCFCSSSKHEKLTEQLKERRFAKSSPA